MNPWQNKKILLTGGSSGIGLAIVQQALLGGAKVSVLTRSLKNAQLEQLKSPSLYVHCGDITKHAEVQQWLVATTQKFEQIDLVINNAGLMYYMDLMKPNYQEMKAMINVNCIGFINLLDVALPILASTSNGHWINITSDAGKQPFPGLAIYSGTKAFVEFSASAMRQELLEHQVKVTNIQPGNVATPLHEKSTDKEAVSKYGTEDKGQYLNTKDIVQAIEYAISTPHSVAVNEILVEPLTESI